MKRLKGLRGKAGMRGYGNIPFLILILWMVVIFFVFRLTMNSIGMQMSAIRWERIGSDLSSWALDLWDWERLRLTAARRSTPW